jgi:hypothetical protein
MRARSTYRSEETIQVARGTPEKVGTPSASKCSLPIKSLTFRLGCAKVPFDWQETERPPATEWDAAGRSVAFSDAGFGENELIGSKSSTNMRLGYEKGVKLRDFRGGRTQFSNP